MGKNTDKVLIFIASVYYKIKNYFFTTDFNRKHLIFKVEEGKLKLSIISHDELVEKTTEKIENFQKKEKNIEKVINFSLKNALENCNFIVFQDTEEENKFVQFWTMGKKLMFDFPIKKTNDHERYKYQILGLLGWLGFNDKEYKSSLPNTDFFGKPYYGYSILKEEKEIIVKANFIKNTDLAAEFTVKAFKEIYKTNLNEITITIN